MCSRFRGKIQHISQDSSHQYDRGTHYNFVVSCPHSPALRVNILIENVRFRRVPNFNNYMVENSPNGYFRLRQGLKYANLQGANNLAPKYAGEIQELLNNHLRIGTEIIVFGTEYPHGIHKVHKSNSHNHDGALFVRQQSGGWMAFFFSIDDWLKWRWTYKSY